MQLGITATISIAILGVIATVATPANADVDLYASPQFGISGLFVDTDGQAQTGGPAATPYGGDDTDGSPLLGLAIGLQVPMDELVPREMLADMRLPSWPMRFELEAAGLRDFDFRTDGAGAGADIFTTEIAATTLMANAWTDIPLITMWRPVQYVFGLGRQPRLRNWIEPGSFYLGAGVGFTALEIDGTDNVLRAKEDIFDFAWNVGAGINYELTERVTLSGGYRYVGLGASTGVQEVDLDLDGSPVGDLEYDLQVHEFRVGIQIRLFSFRGAWR